MVFWSLYAVFQSDRIFYNLIVLLYSANLIHGLIAAVNLLYNSNNLVVSKAYADKVIFLAPNK